MYDYVIITHLPAFYKVNLYRELAKRLNIFVIFISSDTIEKRASDFADLNDVNFQYSVLCHGSFQKRNQVKSIFKLWKITKNLKYKRIIVGGWDLLEFWYLVIFNSKEKNSLALESSVNESKISGVRGLLKKIFLAKVSTVFAAGSLHIELLNKLKFKGTSYISKGVGIINKHQINSQIQLPEYKKKFLYIGRLSTVKNLITLLKVFNDLPDHHLTVVGQGPLKNELHELAKSNVTFIDHIKNKELFTLFSENNFLILPSRSETWGIVIEEALFFGMPVLVSKNCGASELISNNINGFIIDPNNPSEFKKTISEIDNLSYSNLVRNIKNKNIINQKDIEQVNIYYAEVMKS